VQVVTPRQACPRPDGLGRNLRSKTRWFAGFCNSHQVSHFATFFIDARAEISVAESHFAQRGARAARYGRARARSRSVVLLGAAQRRGCLSSGPAGSTCVRRGCGSPRAGHAHARGALLHVLGSSRAGGKGGHINDPSAGSPTETLLRLLLPLNDKVQWTSRDVGGGGPPPSPRSEHFTGPFNR
jgi:hypothetical protein